MQIATQQDDADQKISSSSSPPLFLCHGCFQHSPTPLQFPCQHGYCRGVIRYCSKQCRDQDSCHQDRYDNDDMTTAHHDNDGDSSLGMHSALRCMFIGRHCCAPLSTSSSISKKSNNNNTNDGDDNKQSSKRNDDDDDDDGDNDDDDRVVQIGVVGESFPEYILTASSIPSQVACCNGKNVAQQQKQQFTSTESIVFCQLGLQCRVVLLPHEIDAGGSMLLQIIISPTTTTTTTDDVATQHNDVDGCDREGGVAGKYILCDVMALEPPTAPSVDCRNTSDDTWEWMDMVWLQGVRLWYNEQEYVAAMDLFQRSLRSVFGGDDANGVVQDDVNDKMNYFSHRRYSDDNNDSDNENDNEEYRKLCAQKTYINNFLLRPPPIRSDSERRIKLGRRFCFLGICYLDAQRTLEGREYLLEALRIIRYLQDEDDNDVVTSTTRTAFMELMLSFEENHNMELARLVARWAIDWGCCDWVDVYQRPGYMYTPIVPPHGDEYRPSWCNILEEHYDVICQDFFNLIQQQQQQQRHHHTNNTAQSCFQKEMMMDHPPSHWPKVGSTEHRDTGHEDARVVAGTTSGEGGGGDWREFVLFGSGSNHHHGNTTALRTKALIRKYIPDAVTLSEMGGGEVIFSIIAGNTKIKPHCASTGNVRLTAHLGLVIPGDMLSRNSKNKKCGIRVRDRWHSWTEGKVLIFDDSFEHEVLNDTSFCRAVLLLRFWHPAIPKDERRRTLLDIGSRKERDTKLKFVPPLPAEFACVEARGMMESSCTSCFRNAHDSIRVTLPPNCSQYAEFHCTCGNTI